MLEGFLIGWAIANWMTFWIITTHDGTQLDVWSMSDAVRLLVAITIANTIIFISAIPERVVNEQMMRRSANTSALLSFTER